MRCARHRAGSAVSRPGSRGGAMKLRGRQGERGQATVELAVVLPVALVVAVIAVNALAFFGTCASFDRVARQTVCALATAPASGDDTASLALAVEQALTRQVGEQGEVQVRIGLDTVHGSYRVRADFVWAWDAQRDLRRGASAARARS